MPINKPVIISAVEVGSPARFLRVTYDHDITGSPPTTGYLAEWKENDPLWTPSWSIPPAVDMGIPSNDGGSPVRRFVILIRLSDGFVSDWETFEEYAVGQTSGFNRGGQGSMWGGTAVVAPNELTITDWEDFEDYNEGVVPVMDGGIGWIGAASVVGLPYTIATSGTSYVTATTVSQTIPSTTRVGDLLIAFVMHRDDLASQAGWTLVSNGKSTAGGNAYHALSVFKRLAQSGDSGSTVSWSIPTSRILGLHIISISSPVLIDVQAENHVIYNAANMASTPVAPATLIGRGIILTSFTAAGSSTPSNISAPSGFTLTTPYTTSNNDNKLGVAIKVGESEGASGNFSLNLTAPTNGGVSTTIIIGEV